MKQLIVEASHTYFGGGFVLLEQILKYCEKNALSVLVYLGHSGVYEELKTRNYTYITLKKTGLLSTISRYCRRREHILFFCNLPPFVKNKKSAVYTQNILFINKPSFDKSQTLIFNLKKLIYYNWIKHFSGNASQIACQTPEVQKALWSNMKLKSELFPFYNTITPVETAKKYDFCYVSWPYPHKNHKTLLQAIWQLSEKKVFNIVLTIGDAPENKPIMEEIKAINKRFSREIIVNAGYLSNEETLGLYACSRALVFPSFEETIGLPLIEALQSGIKVLSADRPYSHNVVEGPILFNPNSSESLAETMNNFLNGSYDASIQKIKVPNRLPELINSLQ